MSQTEVGQSWVPTTKLPRDAGAGLTSRRLRLRRFTGEDFPWLAAAYADHEVARFIGGTKTVDECRALFEQRFLAYYDQHPGLGVWLTCKRDDGERIGFHLLNHIQGEPLVQVGYALLKPWWGCGYATEMCRALVHYGAASYGLRTVVAIANLDNHASHRVLLKSGLARKADRSFPHAAYAAQGALAYFERDAAEWLAEFAPKEVLPGIFKG